MITNQTTIQILKETAENKTPIFLSAQDFDIVFQTTILSVESEYLVLENNIPPAHIGAMVAADSYYLQVQMLRFETHTIDSDGAHIIFPLKNLNEIEDSRGAKRFFFDSDDVYMEALNPYDHVTVIRKSVMDISTTGISIKSPVRSKLYTPGTRFEGMKILIDGEIYNQADGEVIYIRKFLDINSKYYYQIGFRLDTLEK